MKRVNIDRDVQSRASISASRPTARTEPKPEPIEPPKNEPQEPIGKEEKAPSGEGESTPATAPATRAKKSGRPPEGEP